MKGLLRSVIDLDGGISQENLVANFQKLLASKVEWVQPGDQRIFDFTKAYFHQRLELPSRQTVADYFDAKKDYEAQERLKDLDGVVPYIRTNYAHLIGTTVEEQSKIKAVLILKEAQQIVAKGLVIGDQKKVGLRDGVLHFMEHAHDLMTQAGGGRTNGDLREDGQEVWDDYQAAKTNKALAWGKFCGLNQIDKVIKGIRKGELWVHAAFTGELKSSFSLNACLNLVTRYRSNVFFISLEVPYEQVRNMIYVMHSASPQWRAMGHEPLDYDRVKAGLLSPEEEAFFQLVIDDFCNNKTYGSFRVWKPDDDVTIREIRTKAEMEHQKDEIHLLVIDHGGLVLAPRERRRDTTTEQQNSVLRDAKRLALQFNHGEMVPVLLLFQISRQGKEAADKDGGRYKLQALAYANEAERSADLVTTTYLNDEHRRAGTTLFDCLKRRDGAKFEPFLAAIHWPSRRITNQQSPVTVSDRGISVDDCKDVADRMFSGGV